MIILQIHGVKKLIYLELFVMDVLLFQLGIMVMLVVDVMVTQMFMQIFMNTILLQIHGHKKQVLAVETEVLELVLHLEAKVMQV